VKDLLNERATKENILRSIDWLRQVSSPGDEVILYVATHGSFFPDRSGNEADGMDEVLVTYDHNWQWNLLPDDELGEQLARFATSCLRRGSCATATRGGCLARWPTGLELLLAADPGAAGAPTCCAGLDRCAARAGADRSKRVATVPVRFLPGVGACRADSHIGRCSGWRSCDDDNPGRATTRNLQPTSWNPYGRHFARDAG
jgi:hypothetical protein